MLSREKIKSTVKKTYKVCVEEGEINILNNWIKNEIIRKTLMSDILHFGYMCYMQGYDNGSEELAKAIRKRLPSGV